MLQQDRRRLKAYLNSRNSLKRVKHIVARVNHPQTNGKIERFYGTLEDKARYFETLDEFVYLYNHKRPHMSLNLDELETPYQAFLRKLSPERVLGYCWRWFDGGK